MQFGYGEGLMNSYQQLFEAYVDDMREAITDARKNNANTMGLKVVNA